MGSVGGAIALAGRGARDLHDPAGVEDPGINRCSGVIVLGGERLEAALDQAAVVGWEVHLVEEVEAVA